MGTSSWLACHVPYKKTDLLHNMATLPSPIPGRYFVSNDQETAGACLAYLRDNILFDPGQAPPDVFERLTAMAGSVAPGSDGVIFTPRLYGERTPVEDHLIRGGFHNISLRTARPHLVRAVLKGVAYNARWLLAAVEGFVKRRFETIRMIGGGAQSGLWCQIYADVLNRPAAGADFWRQGAEPGRVRQPELLRRVAAPQGPCPWPAYIMGGDNERSPPMM